MLSLQDTCLQSIVNNFQKFYDVFTTSKDLRLQRNLLFLQRKFSNYFAENVLKDGNMTDVYFDFLFNEYLTVVDFHWFINSRYLNCIDDIFRRLPNLREMYLNRNCGDEILKCIAKFCPKVLKIGISFSSLRDFERKRAEDMCDTKGMLPCPQTMSFIKYRLKSNITDKGVEFFLRCIPTIEEFDYPNIPVLLHSIHAKNLSEIQNVQYFNFTLLDLTQCADVPHFNEILKTCLLVCPKLTSLLCQLNGEQVKILTSNKLKKVALISPEYNSRINIECFLKDSGRNLTHLRISDCAVTPSVLADNCPVLKDLFLRNVYFKYHRIDIQPIFPSLTNLNLRVADIDALKSFNLRPSSFPKLKSAVFELGIYTEEVRHQILRWCGNSVEMDFFFACAFLRIQFLKSIILNCRFLKRLSLLQCRFHNNYYTDEGNYDSADDDDLRESDPIEILLALAEKHPNKPVICSNISRLMRMY